MFSEIDLLSNNRPLTRTERNRLKSKRRLLLSMISPLSGSLHLELYRQDCISEQHKNYIRGHHGQLSLDQKLLDIIERRSFAQFQHFQSVLPREVSYLLGRDGGIMLLVLLICMNEWMHGCNQGLKVGRIQHVALKVWEGPTCCKPSLICLPPPSIKEFQRI